MDRVSRTLLVTIAIGAIGASPVVTQQTRFLDTDVELKLAMSAGPLEISESADVYVFGPDGFEKALEGNNGYSCLVIRTAGSPDVLAPHCLSPDATETVLPAQLAEGRYIAQGLSRDEVSERLREAWAAGSLPLPSGNAFAYMMSSGQHLGTIGAWEPHFMLYLPYATAADAGGEALNEAMPFVGPLQNHPHSTLVVVMPEFVDPADVTIRK